MPETGEWGIGFSKKFQDKNSCEFLAWNALSLQRAGCATWPTIFHLLCRPSTHSSWNLVYFHAGKIKWEQHLATKNGVAVSVASILPLKAPPVC